MSPADVFDTEPDRQAPDCPCPHCGLLIRAQALQCRHCHRWIRSEETRGDDEAVSESRDSGEQSLIGERWSRGQLPRHLIALWVLTLGAYSFYWFYRNWRDLAEFGGLPIRPGWRTVGLIVPFVNVLLVYNLFKTITLFSSEDGEDFGYPPVFLTAAYFLLVALGNLSQFPAFSLLTVLVVLPLQNALNRSWARREPGLRIREEFVGYELLIIAVALLATFAAAIQS